MSSSPAGVVLKPWFPAALALSTTGGFLLWWSLTDYERARYYPAILAVPATIFAILGFVGISGDIAAYVSQGFKLVQSTHSTIMPIAQMFRGQ